jgi:hypothetical protein
MADVPVTEDPVSGTFDDIQRGCFGSLLLMVVIAGVGLAGLVSLIT